MKASWVYRIAMVCLLVGAIGSVLASSAMARKAAVAPAVCRSSSVLEGLDAEPVELTTAPEPPALSRLGVLRRPAGPADQLPPLSRIGFEVGTELSGYYPGYIRRLVQLPDGSRYFLIPGLKRVPKLPPARCLPKQLRSQHQPKPEPVYCIAGVGASVHQRLGFSCLTLAEIENGGDLGEPYSSSSFEVDLVPDGVAAVRLVYRGGVVITASVSENAFSFTPPQAPIERVKAALRRVEREFENEREPKRKHPTKRRRRHGVNAAIEALNHVLDRLPPTQVQWLDAGGHVLRSFAPTRRRNGFLVTIGSGASRTSAVPAG